MLATLTLLAASGGLATLLWIIAVGAFLTAAHRTVWIARRLRERERPTPPV